MIGIFLQRWPFSIIYAQSAGAMSGTEKLGGLGQFWKIFRAADHMAVY